MDPSGQELDSEGRQQMAKLRDDLTNRAMEIYQHSLERDRQALEQRERELEEDR